MVSQNQGKDKGGRPNALDGKEKTYVRRSHAQWLERVAKKFEVHPMTIRRALFNEKKEAPPADTERG